MLSSTRIICSALWVVPPPPGYSPWSRRFQLTDRFDDRGRRLTLFDEGGLNEEKGFLLELMQDKATYSCSAVGQLRSTVSKGVKLRVSIMARWDQPTRGSQVNTVC